MNSTEKSAVRFNNIDDIIIHIELILKLTPNIEKSIEFELNRHIRDAYTDIINQNLGYCAVLKVPQVGIFNLVDKLDLNIEEIKVVFISEWKLPEKAHMWTDPYYHILLLMLLYGLKVKNDNIVKNCSVLILMKLWNGRKIKYVRYCDPDTMKYVISNMSGKFLSTKYDNPLSLLMQYMSPYLLRTYSNRMLNDSKETKQFFSQGWSRLEQIFRSDMRPDLNTGTVKGHSGLGPLYFKAKESGLKISKPTIYDSEESSSTDFYSSHELDDMINTTINYITMNLQPKYDDKFLNKIHELTMVNIDPASLILKAMHNNKYNDYIRDIIQLMFKQLNINSKSDICDPNFVFSLTKKNIISSKHSKNINELKIICDLLLADIFTDYVKTVNYLDYSQPRQGHLRKVIFYGLSYNIYKSICTK